MIEITSIPSGLSLSDSGSELRPRDQSQLSYWGFSQSDSDEDYVLSTPDALPVLVKLISYLDRSDLPYALDSDVRALIEVHTASQTNFDAAFAKCRDFKQGAIDDGSIDSFTDFAQSSLVRRLKEHQVKAALHLLEAQNGANFSVPGSGKTTVVLSVFHLLRRNDVVDALFVVGPPACFAPWQNEYEKVFGERADATTLSGGNIDERRSAYIVERSSAPDMFLTTFQTLTRDCDYVKALFRHRGIRFFLVVDEAHYVKQLGGTWASAVLDVAKDATRRCVLTGTPFPHSYSDAFNLFDILWPTHPPLSQNNKHRIDVLNNQQQFEAASEVLHDHIGPLFYRVRKQDLGLAPQVFHDPIRIPMRERERFVYDAIIDRIQYLSASDYARDLDTLLRLRRGRMIRLRQCVSYVPLLSTAVDEYSEELIETPSLADIIKHYDDLETPAKLGVLLDLINDYCGRGEKVVVWANFIRTLELIVSHLERRGLGVRLIYGATPFENANPDDELTREKIIEQFIDSRSDVSVLVANPAACAESISLHTACSRAIYYDLSYNCAQYLQSLDRIHRVGGSESKEAHYHLLQYANTIDEDIYRNVRTKADNMSAVIDRDYSIYSLDMFSTDDDADAYTRVFGGNE